MKAPQKILLALLFFTALASACKKTHNETTGCTDPKAINYDKTATINSGCKYQVVDVADAYDVAGAYNVHDTLISFRHNDTMGWYDTAISSFAIHAIAYKADSLDFDTVICIYCSGGYKSVAADFTSFYTAFDYYPVMVTQSGRFSGDTLRYAAGISPLAVPGGYKRMGMGLKAR
jgi:hypothetical protein